MMIPKRTVTRFKICFVFVGKMLISLSCFITENSTAEILVK